MSETPYNENDLLDAECRAFSVYLTGLQSDEYIRRKYREAHPFTGISERRQMGRFDAFMMRFAQRGKTRTRIADVYTRWFYSRATLRKKLLLLLAIQECSATTHDYFEAGDVGGPLRFWLRLVPRGIGFALCFAAGLVFFPPAYVILRALPAGGKPQRVREQWVES